MLSSWRHWLMVLFLGLAACGEGVEPVAEESALGERQASLADLRLRLMAANITSGNGQDYSLGHGTRIFQGTDPDVVMIQEFNYGSNSTADIRSFVDTAFGPQFYYYRESGAQIPNGIVSRYPIVASGEWTDTQVSNRDFAWARIDIPGPKDLWVVSVHLLTASASVRNTESTNLVAYIQSNVPAGDYLAIGGDLNTDSRSEVSFSTLSQVVTTTAPYPADLNGNVNTNANRNKPYDHVLVDSDLRQYQTGVVIGGNTFTGGLVVDTRVYMPISDLSPALASDSASTNMQHMAIIKDFLIPDGGAVSTVKVTSPNGGESWTAGSARTITWTSSNVASVKVDYTLNGGSTWTVLSASTPASTGSLAWTLPSTQSTQAWVRVTDTTSATVTDTSDAAFSITSTGGGTGGLIINEVLVNELGSDVSGEFVELVNTGSAAVSVGGWTVWDSGTMRHTFPAGTTVPAGGVVVVFGAAAGIPAGTPGAVACSTGTLSLTNGGDTVSVRNASGTIVDSVTLPSTLTGTDGVSANRSPDLGTSSTFVLHTTLSTLSTSPGRRVNGASF
ncbi:lamin tail domain-containing protein [Myxococcus landrumensis]|uniref:Lamin tail domain-containing protein n=1 Tax=Myxococcus landrumensis TaxID=2813577 RepID=A0ABX7NH78_9BACT|nr:lamin tail domain-containing protein [Myxococcus landrumus]QSQ17781.1 lamin tail domain-containing protein [Myxococcus landrumus]